MHSLKAETSGFMVLLLIQLTFVLIFGLYGRYDAELLPQDDDTAANRTMAEEAANGGGGGDAHHTRHVPSYAHFQDIHVMIFVGFAFLMTFLKRYGYSATGYNLLVGAFVIQWAIISRGIYELEDGYIPLSLDSLIGADIAAAAVLISMGALLGRTTPIQLLLMGLIEIFVFAFNEYIQLELFKITDAGGSIVVHAFGAYFGLAVSLAMRPARTANAAGRLEGASYTSDTFAMVGTLFLWIFWPSFNSALLDGAEQQRAIINTYLALAGATVTTFVLSAFLSHGNKLDMVHVQNSTLAGGVGVGAICNLLIGPVGAVGTGIAAGAISVLGYRYLTPALTSALRLHDTCGVHNLHGMPAVMSAVFSAIFAASASVASYKSTLTSVFPAMAADGPDKPFGVNMYGRSAAEQAGYQVVGIAVTVGVAIITGALTGLLLRSRMVRNIEKADHHDDAVFWEVPEETSEVTAAAGGAAAGRHEA